MKPLTPNGDIVKWQGSDPLTVASREGIYELARGIALRMAWNKPEAYEKAKQGDWSFVEWEKTPFYTQYKIPWKYDSKVSPLMFAAVRTLIDSLYHEFLKKSERYVGWRKYFSLTCSTFDTFASPDHTVEEIESGRFVDSSRAIPGLIGGKGGIDPYLPERKNDLDIDCGRGSLIDAIHLVGATTNPSVVFKEGLRWIAFYHSDSYDLSLGEASYKRFKENSLTLDDDWELGETALVCMFDRCYWAMEAPDGGLAHPPVRLEETVSGLSVPIGIKDWKFGFDESLGLSYVEIDPEVGNATRTGRDEKRRIGETEEIGLRRSVTTVRAGVNFEYTVKIQAVKDVIDVQTEGQYVSCYVNGTYMSVYWLKRGQEIIVENPPVGVGYNSVETFCEKSMTVDKSFDSVEDYVSKDTFVFWHNKHYVSGDAQPEEHGEMYMTSEKNLKDSFSEFLEMMAGKDGVRQMFVPFTLGVDSSRVKKEKIYLSEDYVDVYSASGIYIGTAAGRWEISPGSWVITEYMPEGMEFHRTFERPWENVVMVNGEDNDGWDGYSNIQAAVIGRNDIPL